MTFTLSSLSLVFDMHRFTQAILLLSAVVSQNMRGTRNCLTIWQCSHCTNKPLCAFIVRPEAEGGNRCIFKAEGIPTGVENVYLSKKICPDDIEISNMSSPESFTTTLIPQAVLVAAQTGSPSEEDTGDGISNITAAGIAVAICFVLGLILCLAAKNCSSRKNFKRPV